MESFDYPFFNNSLKVAFTPDGLIEMRFQRKKVKRRMTETEEALRIMEELDRFMNGESQKLNLDVDWKSLNGTDFQIKVWKKMAKIPFGEVRTYSQIADLIRSPKAARAVGTACGQNPVLLAIPCHRVVGSSGLGGFSGGGLEVKKRLLSLEGTHNQFLPPWETI